MWSCGILRPRQPHEASSFSTSSPTRVVMTLIPAVLVGWRAVPLWF